MITLPRIPLENWYWRYLHGSADNTDTLPFEGSLAGWRAEGPMPGWSLWCLAIVNLEPLDACVRYWLRIDRLPAPVRVRVGGTTVAEHADAPLELDITEHVALERNEILLLLDLSTVEAGARFGSVWLEARPCDSA